MFIKKWRFIGALIVFLLVSCSTIKVISPYHLTITLVYKNSNSTIRLLWICMWDFKSVPMPMDLNGEWGFRSTHIPNQEAMWNLGCSITKH